MILMIMGVAKTAVRKDPKEKKKTRVKKARPVIEQIVAKPAVLPVAVVSNLDPLPAVQFGNMPELSMLSSAGVKRKNEEEDEYGDI
jgi:hypothetical protein